MATSKVCGIYAMVDLRFRHIVYIGQSNDLLRRMRDHRTKCHSSNLEAWIKEIPQDKVEVWILRQCKPKELDFWELFYVCTELRHGNALLNDDNSTVVRKARKLLSIEPPAVEGDYGQRGERGQRG